MSDRPRVGVSACLLGEPVRYDGRDKRDPWLVDVFGPEVDWVAVCPEVEAGFGTPREPMELVRTASGTLALLTIETRHDLTATMGAYADRRVAELALASLDGYVLKADSPSCGLEDPGLFAAALVHRLPSLPVIDERRLGDALARQTFVERVRMHHRSRTQSSTADTWRSVAVVRARSVARVEDLDRVATEEPLEIRLHGRPFAVIMRTPGADRELSAGFLLAESVIRSGDDLGTIEYCLDRDRGGAASNVLNVTLSPSSDRSIDAVLDGRRQMTTSSSCGLCGRRTIESLSTQVTPIRRSWTVSAAAIAVMPSQLRARQAAFDETGGLHAAGLFEVDGGAARLVDIAEDVGRHNAVDKIVGRALMRETLPLANHILCVSGRTSFEIVQKALIAGLPAVAAVSAPSSLAVELASEYGLTLVGFVRGDTFNIYAHPERIEN